MRRFWKAVVLEPEADAWTVRLDDRPLRTPARAALLLPTRALGEAVAEEWRSAGATVDPRSMPMTGLANSAIDRIAPDKSAFASGLARYAEADLACYRSEWPPELVERQAEVWDPLLAWARRSFDVDFVTTSGLLHVPQPTATVDRLAHEVTVIDAFRLAGLSPLVTIGGSLIAALAVLQKSMTPEEAWQAVSIDERWQLDRWGSDAEAVTALENRRADFMAAASFLELLD